MDLFGNTWLVLENMISIDLFAGNRGVGACQRQFDSGWLLIHSHLQWIRDPGTSSPVLATRVEHNHSLFVMKRGRLSFSEGNESDSQSDSTYDSPSFLATPAPTCFLLSRPWIFAFLTFPYYFCFIDLVSILSPSFSISKLRASGIRETKWLKLECKTCKIYLSSTHLRHRVQH